MAKKSPSAKQPKRLPRPKGRPIDLTPEVSEVILRALRLGSYIETAVVYAGIHKETYYHWIRRGLRGEETYKAFNDSVQKAMADGEMRDLARIDAAGGMSWQAVAWKLERRNYEKWGRKERIDVNNHTPQAAEYDFGRLSKAEHEEFMRLLAKARVPDAVDAEFEDVKQGALVEGEG